MIARRMNDVHQVVDERLVDVDRRDALLQLHHFLRLQHGLEMIERVLRAAGAEQFLFVERIRISDRQLHQKPIELRFGQRIRSDMFDWILGRDHEEWIGKRQAPFFDADHALAHRLQQRRLRFWRGAIDLVSEKYVRENRTGDELEFLLVLVVDRHADDVGGQKIARELDALK